MSETAAEAALPASGADLQRPILAIVGPTAVGKSALAMRLAVEADGEIVNADALQIYRGFDLGTAKPTPEERAAVPHHLVDFVDPLERFSAGEFARRARLAIAEIASRGKLPILVGGSGLYLRGLLEGLSPIPEVDRRVREELEERLETEGLGALRAELAKLDPATAERLGAGDRQRILRALEVALSTGRPLSSWIRDRPFGEHRIEARRIGLTLPREILYDRVDARVREMVKRGWVAEVRALLDQGIPPSAPAFQAIGYRQMARHVLEGWSLGEAIDDTARATRRYAKRQLTWFRKEPDIQWISALRWIETIPLLLKGLAGDFAKAADGSSISCPSHHSPGGTLLDEQA